LNARPYAFLDDAPLEERRTQAVQNRRYTDPESADDLGQLDADAIASVREEAWPQVRSADEMHEALGMLGACERRRGGHKKADWKKWLAALAKAGRVTRLLLQGKGRTARGLWVTAERLHAAAGRGARCADAARHRSPRRCRAAGRPRDRAARAAALAPRRARPGHRRATCHGAAFGRDVESALLALQTEGSVLQGRFTPGAAEPEWCERHLLARIHRYTLKRLRREIEPVEPRDFVRFLFEWQHIGAGRRVSGPEALSGILSQLEGYEAPGRCGRPSCCRPA
jgi:ATP-dependent Lhr-like helicase